MSWINVSNITSALKTQLETNLTTFQGGVSRGEFVNMEPHNTPWVGIYRGSVEYNPRTLGSASRSWDGVVTIRLIVQATSISGEDTAEDDIEAAIKEVIDAVFTDKTISNTVDMLTGMNIDYGFQETEEETLLFQQAEITLEYKVQGN